MTSQAIPHQSAAVMASPPSPRLVADRSSWRGVKRTRSIRRPSIRSTRKVPASMSTVSPTFASRPSSLIRKPATVSYGPSSGTDDARALDEFVGAQRSGKGQPVAAAHHVGAGAVVLVGHLADQLFDQVFEGGDTGGSAVFVDHDRPSDSRGRAARRAGCRASWSRAPAGHRTAGPTPAPRRAARAAPPTACLMCTRPTTSSMSSSMTGKRENPVSCEPARPPRRRSPSGRCSPGAVAGSSRRPRCGPRTPGCARAASPCRGRASPRLAERRTQAAQLFGGARRAQLLLRLDAHDPQQRVGRAVQQPDERLEDDGETELERDDDLGDLTRDRERQVLRHQLADDHRQQGRDGDRHDGRDRARPPRWADGWPVNTGCRNALNAGSSVNPVSSVVSVMPSCALERWVEVRFSPLMTGPSIVSPRSWRASRSARSRLTSVNSLATKNPVPMVSTIPMIRRIHSELTAQPRSFRRPDGGSSMIRPSISSARVASLRASPVAPRSQVRSGAVSETAFQFAPNCAPKLKWRFLTTSRTGAGVDASRFDDISRPATARGRCPR